MKENTTLMGFLYLGARNGVLQSLCYVGACSVSPPFLVPFFMYIHKQKRSMKKSMKIIIDASLFDDYSLDLYDIAFLQVLPTFIELETGACFASMSKICKLARMSERKGFQVKAKLIKNGVIKSVNRFDVDGTQLADAIVLIDARIKARIEFSND